MAFIADSVFDSGLGTISGTSNRTLHICSAEPANYAGIAAVTLGNKASLTVGSPTNGATDGRRVITNAITDGSVTGTGTAAYWALTDGTSVMYATGSLTSSQSVTSGNTFTLDAISITLRDAT